MMAYLQQELFVLGGTPISPLHILAFFVTLVGVAWTYLKGMPFMEKEEEQESYEHKPLNELREPPMRYLVRKWGKSLNRELVHDKKKVGVIDRELTYWVDTTAENKKSAGKKKGEKDDDSPKLVSDAMSSNIDTKNMERVSIYYIRPDKFYYDLAKKFVGLPERIYDIVIIPDRFLMDADQLVLDKNVNIIQYAGIDTVWSSEVQNLFKAFLQNDIGEQMDENIVNFLRRITHFDTEQAKATQFKEFETEMEKARWGAKEQSDASKV